MTAEHSSSPARSRSTGKRGFPKRFSFRDFFFAGIVVISLLCVLGYMAYSLRHFSTMQDGVSSPDTPWMAPGMSVKDTHSGWVQAKDGGETYFPVATIDLSPLSEERGEVIIQFLNNLGMPMGDTISFYWENGSIRGQDSLRVTATGTKGITGKNYIDEYVFDRREPWSYRVIYRKIGQQAHLMGVAEIGRVLF